MTPEKLRSLMPQDAIPEIPEWTKPDSESGGKNSVEGENLYKLQNKLLAVAISYYNFCDCLDTYRFLLEDLMQAAFDTDLNDTSHFDTQEEDFVPDLRVVWDVLQSYNHKSRRSDGSIINPYGNHNGPVNKTRS